jgi:hypothetical protein
LVKKIVEKIQGAHFVFKNTFVKILLFRSNVEGYDKGRHAGRQAGHR